MLYTKKTCSIGIGSFLCLSLIFSCENYGKDIKNKPTGKKAYATLNPTKDNKVSGEIRFITIDKGVRVVAQIKDLSPGYHGIHIHEFGDCSAPDASSAGGHFNPEGNIHAGPEDLPRHIGDLGNVFADRHGNAYYDRVDFSLSLSGSESIIGKSVIIHEKRDDYVSQPTGNAGPRIACGVIQEDSRK